MKEREYIEPDMRIVNPNNPACSLDIYAYSNSHLKNSNGERIREKDLTTRSGELYEGVSIAFGAWNNPECENEDMREKVVRSGFAPELHTTPQAIDSVLQKARVLMEECPYRDGARCKQNYRES